MGDVDGLHMSAAKRAHQGREACIMLVLRDQPTKALALRAVTTDDTAAWMSICQVSFEATSTASHVNKVQLRLGSAGLEY